MTYEILGCLLCHLLDIKCLRTGSTNLLNLLRIILLYQKVFLIHNLFQDLLCLSHLRYSSFFKSHLTLKLINLRLQYFTRLHITLTGFVFGIKRCLVKFSRLYLRSSIQALMNAPKSTSSRRKIKKLLSCFRRK